MKKNNNIKMTWEQNENKSTTAWNNLTMSNVEQPGVNIKQSDNKVKTTWQ